MTSLVNVLRDAQRSLESVGIPDARIEAEVLLTVTLDLDRAALYACLNVFIAPEKVAAVHRLLERRLRREPLAHIVGRREFFGLDLEVGPAALVPRQETETLVEEALKAACQRGGSCAIADVGTGCGAIAVALAVHLPAARLYATDISPEALRLARANCLRHGVGERVALLEGDLLAPLPEPVDLVVANLPYVPTAEIDTLQPEVRLHEPRIALDGGPDGLDVIRRLLCQAPRWLDAGGALLLEIDPHQVCGVLETAHASFPGAALRTIRDLAGRERVVVIEVAPHAKSTTVAPSPPRSGSAAA
ncbi:MAG: peptide chain release factor N(5)-glutamine methyltransferase [Chloroflexi bacterium]|nr:peptide chain release factor N(5)-glutamine methyltransferase [Chloroflexota bacterium]